MREYSNTKILDEKAVLQAIRQRSHPIVNISGLNTLMDRIGDDRIVMLGESSHGTHEYYTWRSHITERLVKEKGFNFLCVEGDWPDCYRLNRYIKNYDRKHENAFHVLKTFDRWPTWMWGNWEIVALGEWLLEHNKGFPANKKVGFYGLDVYSLWESLEEIIHYLEKRQDAEIPGVKKWQGVKKWRIKICLLPGKLLCIQRAAINKVLRPAYLLYQSIQYEVQTPSCI